MMLFLKFPCSQTKGEWIKILSAHNGDEMEQVWVTEKEKVRSNIMQKVNMKKKVTNIPKF